MLLLGYYKFSLGLKAGKCFIISGNAWSFREMETLEAVVVRKAVQCASTFERNDLEYYYDCIFETQVR